MVALACHPAQPLVLSAGADGVLAVTHCGSARLASHCPDLSPTAGGGGGLLEGLAVSAKGGMCVAAWRTRFEVRGGGPGVHG